MTISAVIAEYNPFHNGHKFQLDTIKSDYKIVIMSSSFTQRGTPAVLSKFQRAKLAVENGADLVLELPVIFSTANAEIFARGAISILNTLNVVDELCFGAEDSIDDLVQLATLTENTDLIKENIKKGYSYIVSKQMSFTNLSQSQKQMLAKPNNILAIEYIRSLQKTNSSIKPVALGRKNVDHSSDEIVDGFASASKIRNLFFEKNLNALKELVPENTFSMLHKSEYNPNVELLKLFKYKLFIGNVDFHNYMDYEAGLENRFFQFINETDYNTFVDLIQTKRYTRSRIQRLILQIILDLKRDLIVESLGAPYVRILAINDKGRDLLKLFKENNINYFDKFSNLKVEDLTIKKIVEKELLASRVYSLLNSSEYNQDYKNNIFK